MLNRQFHIILLVTLCCLSCRKDREVGNYLGEYELIGYVRDEITQKPIPYALVGVVVQARDKFYNFGGQEPATGRTDANGRFTLKFFVDQEKFRYELMAEAIQYFSMGGSGDQITFTKNGKKSQDVRLLPEAYVKYIIKGNKGAEKMSVHGINGGATYRKNADTFLTSRILPYYLTRIGYSVYGIRDSLLHLQRDSIIVRGHDTGYYLIEF